MADEEKKPDEFEPVDDEYGMSQPEEDLPQEEAEEDEAPPKAKFSPVDWVKENPKPAKLALLVVLLLVALVLVLFFTGVFGSCEKKTPRPVQPPPRVALPAPAQPAQPGAAAKGEGEKEETEPAEEEEPEPEPPRPEEIADWVKEDYLSARAEDDPRLVEAIGHLGQRFAGNASAAGMLAELLAPPKAEEEEPPPTGKPARPVRSTARPGDAKLIEAVVAALIENDTAKARAILERMLAGKVETEDDKATVAAALKALVANPRPEHEGILYRALIGPEKLRAGAEGAITAEQLRADVLKLVEPVASDKFRKALAKHLCQPTVPPAIRQQLGKFLEAKLPENLDAQLVFYKYQRTDPALREDLETYFTDFSSQSLAKLLGVEAESAGASRRPVRRVTPVRRPGTAEEPPDPDLPYRLARLLWGAGCVTLLEGRLANVNSLEKQAQLVALSGTVPVESVRAGLYRQLWKHWDDGPDGLKKTALVDKLVCDPGFVILVKGLPREEPKDIKVSTRPKPRPTRPKPRRPGSSTRPKTQVSEAVKAAAAAAQKEEQQREKAKEGWLDTSEELMRVWCERLHAAGAARAEAARLAGRAADDLPYAELRPVPLHDDTNVVSEYHVEFPGEAQQKLSGVTAGKTTVHYVRIEGRGNPVGVSGFYRRQLLRMREEPRELDKATWVDSLRQDPQTGRQRSVDVLVTQLEDEPDPDSRDGEDLRIELLSVEINDPGLR